MMRESNPNLFKILKLLCDLLQLEEDLPLPPQQTQQQHPAVNNAPHMSHTPSHEQMLIDQYISSSESNPMDSHLTTLKSMAQEVMTRAGLNFTADQREGLILSLSM